MRNDTRGLSAVITTLIIILLVLVAVGIVWVVVNNLLKGGAETIELTAKCTAVTLSATAVTCDDAGVNWTCDVTYERGSGGDAVDGMKIVLSNGVTSFTEDITGDIGQLGPNTKTGIDTQIVIADTEPNSVQLAAYFNDTSGNSQLCSPTSEFTF